MVTSIVVSQIEDVKMAKGGFPRMPGGNMNNMIKQAQKMQEDMAALQEELDAKEYEIKAGKILIEMPQTSATILKFIEE